MSQQKIELLANKKPSKVCFSFVKKYLIERFFMQTI